MTETKTDAPLLPEGHVAVPAPLLHATLGVVSALPYRQARPIMRLYEQAGILAEGPGDADQEPSS